MEHIFEQINHLFGDAEVAGILVIVLILSLIVMNITVCVCIISMRGSLKKIANPESCKNEGAAKKSEKVAREE